jgi:hypothetical protein
MASESYGNALSTTINQGGGIASGDTTVTVTSTLNWPQPQFRILIESEIILVTGVSSNTFTIVRGQEGTTAAAHANGIAVTQVLTVGGLFGLVGDAILSSSYAALPSSSLLGRLYLPTDGISLLRDTSSSWNPWGRVTELTAPPLASTLTAVNVTTATLVDNAGSLFLNAPSIGASHAELWVKTLAAGAYTWIVHLESWIHSSTFTSCGLALRDSGGGKLLTLEQSIFSGSLTLRVVQWTDANTRGSDAFNNTLLGKTYTWFKIHDDGTTNRTYSVSHDGINWLDVFTEGRTTFLGVAPNQAGVFACANGLPVAVGVYSWNGV